MTDKCQGHLSRSYLPEFLPIGLVDFLYRELLKFMKSWSVLKMQFFDIHVPNFCRRLDTGTKLSLPFK